MKLLLAFAALLTVAPIGLPAADAQLGNAPQVRTTNRRPHKVQVHRGKKHRKA